MHLKACDTRHCLVSLISLCSRPLNPFELIPDYIFVPLSSFTFTDFSEVVILEWGEGRTGTGILKLMQYMCCLRFFGVQCVFSDLYQISACLASACPHACQMHHRSRSSRVWQPKEQDSRTEISSYRYLPTSLRIMLMGKKTSGLM